MDIHVWTMAYQFKNMEECTGYPRFYGMSGNMLYIIWCGFLFAGYVCFRPLSVASFDKTFEWRKW